MKASVFCIWFGASIVSVMAVYGAGTEVGEGARYGPVTAGCRLSMSTTQPSFRFDEPVRVRLVTENLSTPNVHVSFPSQFAFVAYRFDISGSDGKPVPLTRYGQRQMDRAGSQPSAAVQPGESDVLDLAMFNRLYDMTIAGEYTVTAYRRVYPPGGSVEVQSNTIKIIIHEQKATSN